MKKDQHMMRTAEEKMREALIEQASLWQARNLSGELTPAEKVEFLQWLRDSPHHVQEYLLNTQIAKLMPQALAGASNGSDVEDQDIRKVVPLKANPAARSARHTPRLLRLATAAMLVCGMAYFGLQHYQSRSVLQVTVPHGDQRMLRLEDGSIVHFNSQSQARVRYSKQERLIELEEGQALFNVARDVSRPFRVRAGSAEILALGTQFDVYRRKKGDITVTVVEGTVAVLDHNGLPPAGNEGGIAPPAVPVNLSAGEQIHLGTRMEERTVKAVNVSNETAWIRRQIIFKGRPLGEVADEFSRYLSVPVRIEDARLRETRISGIFSAYDEEAFVAFLKEFPGVEVEGEGDVIVVRRVKARGGTT